MTSEPEIVRKYSTLEKARLDFQVLRVQFFLGFLCAALSLAMLFCHSEQVTHVLNVSQSISARLGSCPPENLYRRGSASSLLPGASPIDQILCDLDSVLSSRIHIKLTGFLVYLSATLALGLVVLELTGKTGNRLGAVPAIWAMLLFAVVPNGVLFLENEPLRADLLNCLLILIAIFAALRFQLTRQKILLAIVGLGLAAAFVELFFQTSYLWRQGVRPAPAASEIIRMCSNFLGELLGLGNLASFPMAAIITLGIVRFFTKTIPLRIGLATLACLASIGLSLTFVSGAFNSAALTLEAEPLSFVGRAAVCAFLPMVALQASGRAPRKQAIVSNFIAVTALTAIFCDWLFQALKTV